MTNTLGIMLEILNNYPWTRLTVRIIGAIKRQFFHMVRHVFDNGNLSQKIFAIDTWRAVGYVHTVPDRFLLRFKSCSGTV